MSFSDLFTRRRKDDPDAADAASDGPLHPTRALTKFLASLSAKNQEQPVLLDLGPVVGANVTFFGERLGCKIFVEDLSKDLDQHAKEHTLDQLPGFLAKRFPQETDSVDGILCWDVFDYLDRAAAIPLATQLTRILRPEGALLAFFSTEEPVPDVKAGAFKPTYTRHIVADPANLQHRAYPAARGKQRPMQNRDIQRLFEPLRITEQILLKTKMRELLFRKPANTL
jgi:hypothetical protein